MVRYAIYCIFCGDSVYIGRTKDVIHRMVRHGNPPFWAVLEIVEGEESGADRERYWMERFESLGATLLNKRSAVRGFLARPQPLRLLSWLKEQVTKYWDSDECLLWPYSTRGPGYGQVPVGNGKADYTHIVAWKFANPGQVIPKGMDVMHGDTCSRRCFNRNHLTLGTRRQNMESAKRLGRTRGPGAATAGEKNGRAVLTQAKVMRIRELSATGLSERKIAAHFDVGRTTIQRIVKRETWAHLPADEILARPLRRNKIVNLWVQSEGSRELLEIVLPITIHIGPALWELRDANGTDYFFDFEGYYDGWGGALPLRTAREQAAS